MAERYISWHGGEPMDDQRIEPALTPKEWADGCTHWGESYGDTNVSLDPHRGGIAIRSGDDNVEIGPHGLCAVMALANHALTDDHPGKITRADVELIGRASGLYREIPIFDKLAAKLAALLPPDA